jgi:UPF0176 protein
MLVNINEDTPMDNKTRYCVLAYYQFAPIHDPHQEVLTHKAFFEGRDATSRIYISESGINGQMSASEKDAQAYMEWMHSRPEFAKVHFKIHPYHENVFPRLTIKYRKHLVAYDEYVDLSKQGEHVSPKQWKEMLENEQDYVLLDVRNQYEWKVGRFEGAELPPCETFKEFGDYAKELKQRVDPKTTKVMMYCTGGIRCELYSAVLKTDGFEQVYQLNGGVINYGQEEGGDHWLGKLFVFDDRLVVPICEKETPKIGTCHHCGVSSDHYYNCANMDCNELFLCCPECLKQYAGCCETSCQESPRLRPYHQQHPHKPFRKWYNYFPA